MGQPRDRVRSETRRLLVAGVTGRVFPGGAASVSWRQGTSQVQIAATAGALMLSGAPVADDTLYDLGALTQSFVAMAALRIASRGEIDLRAPVESILNEVRGGVLTGVPLVALFEHRGGLAPWGGFYLDVPHDLGSPAARRWILAEAARRPGDKPGGVEERSDLGCMIAGEALVRLVGAPLDEVIAKEIVAPLGVSEDELAFVGALPSDRRAALNRRTAPTERCSWRGRLVQGEVHDENATALGGVAGHAGLFGTARAVATFGRAILESLAGRGDFLESSAIREALEAREGSEHLRFGWDLAEGASPPCGRRMSPATFGKVGFTGTSLFLDPARDVVVALLTNRVCPSRANEKIDGFRPGFHDGVMTALSG